MTGTVILTVYNNALKLIGETRLATISEDREPRRALDDAYSDALNLCLEEGQWNFAKRDVQIDKDATAPSFGFQFRFAKPADFVRLMAFSADEFFSRPLADASDQPGWWYANADPIYVSYVSNGASYGLDLTKWPLSFARYVEHELAERVCVQLTNSDTKYQELIKMKVRAKRDALNKDAMNDVTPKFRPAGAFVRSRQVGNQNYAGTFRSGVYYR